MEYAEDLATTLELERLDRDLFRGVNTVMAKERSSLFGGQVCAQALMAAALTVEPEPSAALVAWLLPAARPDRQAGTAPGGPRPRRPLVLRPTRRRGAGR